MVISRDASVVPTEETERYDSVSEYLDEQSAEQEIDVLAGLREIDGADGARFRIYRVGATNPELNGFLDEVGSEQLSATYIRDKFGGGKYRIRCHLPNGRIAAHRKVEIAGDAPMRPTASPASAPATGGFDLQRFLIEQETREESRRERARKERNELLAILVPAVSPIVAAMIGNRGPDISALVTALKPPPAPTMPELMTALASLKSLAPEQTNDPLDRAIKVLDIIRDRAPAEGGETGMLDIVKEVIRAAGPTIGTVIEGAVQSAMAANNPQAVPALTAPAPTQTTSETSEMLALLKLQPWLKAQLGMALEKAARGSDPSLIAERIIDDIPDGVAPALLIEFVARVDWFTMLAQFEPRVAAYQVWFTQMRQAMLKQFGAQTAPAMNVTTDTQIDRPVGPPSLTGE